MADRPLPFPTTGRSTFATAQAASLWTGYHFADNQFAALDLAHHRILFASPDAWRFLGWRAPDSVTGQLPAEFFGRLPR